MSASPASVSPTASVVRSAAQGLLITACAFVLAGCAEVVASSKHSREQGQKLYAQGEYTEAAGALRLAVRDDPTDYRSWFWLGQSYDKAQ